MLAWPPGVGAIMGQANRGHSGFCPRPVGGCTAAKWGARRQQVPSLQPGVAPAGAGKDPTLASRINSFLKEQ